MDYITSPSLKLSGQITVPGDKSISHRAVMLGSIASGQSTVTGFLMGEDCIATMSAFRSMGVCIEQTDEHSLVIHGVGLHGLAKPNHALDLGNSGTSIRLLAGLLSGQRFASVLTGDASLCNRPMNRVVLPLKQMGAKIEASLEGKPPLIIQPSGDLKAIKFASPIASAQVKSCILLAGLYAQGQTQVSEPAVSRDHTERMLRGFGVEVEQNQNSISLVGGQELKATSINIPGDISSAAFFIVAGTITPNSNILLKNVGINPTRIGCLKILEAMGANIQISASRMVCGEPVADIHVQSAKLKGIEIPSEWVHLAIDEFPVLFIAAAAANGRTIVRNAKELRVKESDRIHGMALGLKTLGIECEELEDGIIITGGKINGGEIECFHDHRIAMAFSIAGLIANSAIKINGCENVRTSFPNFITLYRSIGGNISEE